MRGRLTRVRLERADLAAQRLHARRQYGDDLLAADIREMIRQYEAAHGPVEPLYREEELPEEDWQRLTGQEFIGYAKGLLGLVEAEGAEFSH